MKAHLILFATVAIAGGTLGQGCAGYRDRATGEEARYACETLRARLDLGIGTVYVAARRAAVDLRLRFARAAEDGISGEIRAMDAQLDSVEIRLGALPENRTIVNIRVGPFGDRNKSIVIFEQIMENLSQADQVAAAPTLLGSNLLAGPGWALGR